MAVTSLVQLFVLLMTFKSCLFHCVDVMNCTCKEDNMGHIIADCSSRKLYNVPKFENNVTVINLNYNQITHLSTFKEMPAGLLELYISNNQLRHFSNNSFWSMTRLQCLDLSNNMLKYTPDVYHPWLFKDLSNLQTLKIYNNNLHSTEKGAYPVILGELRSIISLYLDGLNASHVSTAFPSMPTLKYLDFALDDNCKMHIIRSNFFENSGNLVSVNVSQCNLANVEKGAFDSLQYLQTLNISNNEGLTFAVLPNITYDLQFTAIKEIDISRLHCMYGVGTNLFTNDMKWLVNTSLHTISLNSNRLAMIESGLLYNLPTSVKYVYMTDNRLTMGLYAFQLGCLKNVIFLDISGQYTSHDPRKPKRRFKDCYDWRGPPPDTSDRITPAIVRDEFMYTQPTSSQLIEYGDHILKNPVEHRKPQQDRDIRIIIHLPPKAETVKVERSDLVYEIDRLKVDVNNNIKTIKAKDNFFYSWIGPITNLHHLEYLDLSNNFCSKVTPFFFDDVPNLETLLINNNYLGFALCSEKAEQSFQYLQKLKIMDISSNRITHLGSRIFQNQTNMVHLNLSHNSLREFRVRIGHMKYLKYLDLSNNELSYLDTDAIADIEQISLNTNISINLSNNAFQCSCERRHFLHWLFSNRHRFVNFELYHCVLNNDTTISLRNIQQTLAQMDRDCSSYIGLIIGVMSAIVLSVAIILGGFVYRYRWKLRYLYYMTKNKFSINFQVHDRSFRKRVFTYDAFVSYAEEDSMFVTGDLCRSLEETRQFSLCLHQRDFTPGRDIAGNITNAVHNSRKTVVILSPDFVRSYWCMFEFNMARMEGLYSREGTNVLFLVFYKRLQPDEIPLPLMEVIKTDCFLEYPGDEQGDMVFWDKMAEALTD